MAPIVPILDLDTLTDRQRIKIDGTLFDLRTREEFSFLHARHNAKRFERLGALMNPKTLTAKDEAERSRLLDQFCRLILVAPGAVHAKLRDIHRLAIVTAFFQTRSRK